MFYHKLCTLFWAARSAVVKAPPLQPAKCIQPEVKSSNLFPSDKSLFWHYCNIYNLAIGLYFNKE